MSEVLPKADQERRYSTGELVRRLMALAWGFRADCLLSLALSVALLLLGLAGLQLLGVVIDVIRHGLGLMAQGNRQRAMRTLRFGQAAYPRHLRANPRAWAFRGLLALGPIGTVIAAALRRRYGMQVDPIGV